MHSVRKKLRIGLLMDSMTVPVWVSEMLDRIHGSDYAQVELVVLNGAKADSLSVFQKLTQQWKQLPSIVIRKSLWGLYNLIDRRPCAQLDRLGFVGPAQLAPTVADRGRLRAVARVEPRSRGHLGDRAAQSSGCRGRRGYRPASGCGRAATSPCRTSRPGRS